MAGEWLKFECSLPEKPETLGITVAMGWDDPDLTVGKLMRLFRWFDQHTVDGNATSVTPSLLDRIIGVSGFVQAVANAGWVVIDPAGVSLHNFERHNGTTAKSRGLTAKRVANHRAEAVRNAAGNDPIVTPPLAREEKKREDYSVPIGTGGKPPMTDPDEIIFGYGLALLTNAGTAEKQACSFLGGLRKHHGDNALIDKLRDCAKAKPLQPLEWLAAALPPGGSKPKLNKQETLEAQNNAVAERFIANLGGAHETE
ncbi:MAG: hypothetical protein ACREVW_09470 [Burkholderiales bacterium]